MKCVPANQSAVACLDPAVGLSTLFRPLGNVRHRPSLDVSYDLGDERTLRFSAREALGAREQTTLLAVLSLARKWPRTDAEFTVLDRPSNLEPSLSLLQALGGPAGTGEATTVMLSFTWTALNQRCGVGSGGSAGDVQRECLRRLCEVVVWEEAGRRRVTAQSYLMVWLLGDDKRVYVVLNTRLAAALLGAQYVQVPLCERNALSTDVQKLSHAFLCTSVRPGASLRISPAALVARLWPDNDAAPEGTRRRRARDARLALQALGRLDGWQVLWDGGVATVRRQATVGVRAPTTPRSVTASARERTNGEKRNNDNDLSLSDVSGLFK